MMTFRQCAAAISLVVISASVAATHSDAVVLDADAMTSYSLPDLVAHLREGEFEQSDQFVGALEQALQRSRAEDDGQYFAAVCAALTRLHYRRSNFAKGYQVVTGCLQDPLAQLNASDFVDLRGIEAVQLFLTGRADESRAIMQQIIRENPDAVEPAVMRRIRVNYASIMKTDGEVLVALTMLTDLLREALRDGTVAEQLRIGNNLVVTLQEEQLYRDAASWIERLQPVISRSDDEFIVMSLRLHELHLQGMLGDRERAIERLQAYIDKNEGGPPVMIGSAYEMLSDFLFETSRYESSRAAAAKAVDVLSTNPLELSNATLALARANIALGELDTAEQQLVELREQGIQDVNSLENLESLELKLGLARSSDPTLLQTFQRLLDTNERRQRLKEEQHTRYFDAQQDAAANAAELERLEREQDLLLAKSAANEARADSVRQSRNLTFVSSASVVVFVGLLGYLLSRRRFDRRFRDQQEALTKELESEVKVQSEALARRAHNEALGQLTGNVAHDFNNLLQVMSIANERLATESISDASTRLLQGSNEALSSARGIIGRLLAYARQQELDEHPISIPDFLDDARPLLEAALGKSVSLEVVSFLPPTVGIKADTAQLTSALINLLKNAAEAMTGSGTVRLAFELLEVREDDTSGDLDLAVGRYIQLSVSDDGVGMSEDQVRRAIEPFFSTRTEVSGTGLGLSSVYGFARQSGGDLKITSVRGQGTTVSLYFPVVPVRLGERRESAPVEIRHSELGALVVEDNAVLGEALVAMLEFMGISPYLVTSGEAAMSELTARADQIDFVISDIRMPGQYDGLMLADWVEANFPTLPILLMSGFSDSERIERPVLRKPFTQAELEAALARVSRSDQSLSGGPLNDGRGERI
ncbi:MAG: ATP-binding protein [Pseudomonadota bacterium]